MVLLAEACNDLLIEMLRAEYINAAFVVDSQGYLVAQRIRQLPGDRSTLAVQTITVQGAINCFGTAIGLGESRQIMLECDAGVVMMAPLAVHGTLVVIAAPSVTLGLFRTFFGGFLQRVSKQVAELDSQRNEASS